MSTTLFDFPHPVDEVSARLVAPISGRYSGQRFIRVLRTEDDAKVEDLLESVVCSRAGMKSGVTVFGGEGDSVQVARIVCLG